MKTIKINIHSFVDVITNSSTMIYVSCNSGTLKTIKELMSLIIKEVDIDLTADDLFEFKIKRLCTHKETEEEKEFELTYDKNGNANFEESFDEEKWDTSSYNGYNQDSLYITSKNNKALKIDLADKIQEIFTIDGSYDG
ncbi:MAG: hypothetical protein WC755_08490 [Candidatus Woesearchaeota archaeon]|jgi:hypothetical protein